MHKLILDYTNCHPFGLLCKSIFLQDIPLHEHTVPFLERKKSRNAQFPTAVTDAAFHLPFESAIKRLITSEPVRHKVSLVAAQCSQFWQHLCL